MYSLSVRVQNVFGFFTTVAFFTALLTALSVLVISQHPTATIEPVLRNVQVVKGRPYYYSAKKEEYASIKFDLDADFTSLFNWNTKQLFVWIATTYSPLPSLSDEPQPMSQAVIWDTIINSESQQHPFKPWLYLEPLYSKYTGASSSSKARSRKTRENSKSTPPSSDVQPGIIQLKNVKPKYQITDISGVLSSRSNVTLEIGWNVQPWVGMLTWTIPDGHKGGLGRWAGVQGGRSKAFDLPSLKGAKPVDAGTPPADQKKKPKPADASPII